MDFVAKILLESSHHSNGSNGAIGGRGCREGLQDPVTQGGIIDVFLERLGEIIGNPRIRCGVSITFVADCNLLLAIVGYEVGSKGFGICVYV